LIRTDPFIKPSDKPKQTVRASIILFPMPVVANQKVALMLYFVECWDFWMWLTGATDLVDIDVQNENVKSNMPLKAGSRMAPRSLKMDTEVMISDKGQLVIEITSSSSNSKASLLAIEIHALANDDDKNGTVETSYHSGSHSSTNRYADDS